MPITVEEMAALKNYNWPGNIRELENFVELIINMEYIPVETNSPLEIKSGEIILKEKKPISRIYGKKTT